MASAAPTIAGASPAVAQLAASGMAPASAGMDDGAPEEEAERDPYKKKRTTKPRAGSTAKALEDQIDDINLARFIDEATLREIGMAVVDEFEIDDNSRSDWMTKSEKALRFANQDTQPKEIPWPGASSVIYPLISQAAIEFASRTYPALIQGRNVVKGVVWGSDKGTPAMEGGKPKMAPVAQPGMGAMPGAAPGAPNPGTSAPPPSDLPPPAEGQEYVWLIAPGEKTERAQRIGEHMSWQLLEEMPEWEPETDQLLQQLPIIGGAARKTYRDIPEGRNVSAYVPLCNLVWNYQATSFEAAPRHTEKLLYYPYQISDFERIGREPIKGDDEESEDETEGMFLELDYGPGDGAFSNGVKFGWNRDGDSGGDQADPDAPHLFLEQHRRWDLDGDGYAEPYVVTVHHRSSKVVRIVARYDKDGIESTNGGDFIRKITPVEHYTLISFFPSIDGGSYPMGFGHLLYGLNDQINSALNQMFDAGTLQNSGGGFISDQLNVASGQTLFQVGTYKRVNSKGMSIRDAVFPLDFKGPSPTLFQLLGVLLEAAKGIAGLQNVLAGDASIANAPPTTVLALIEQGMKVYTAIQKRIFRAFKSEFGKLYRLNRIYITEPVDYQLGDDERQIHPSDYRIGGGVKPIADPNMVTEMQRITRGQVLMTFANEPEMNRTEIFRRVLESADFERIDELFAPPNPMMPVLAQLDMATKQAELGRTRAAEQKDTTQAFLNLALARSKASAQEETFINSQLQFLRLKIEALNTEVKAADVSGKHHGVALDHMDRVAARAHELNMAGMAAAAPGGMGGATPDAATALPTPGPAGAFPAGPDSAVPPPPGGGGGPTPAAEPIPGGIPARAAGGPVKAGQPYWVGEHGPEQIIPDHDGTVIPNGGTAPVVPDMTASYNTALDPDREKEFQGWLKTSGRQHDLYDYDMRGAWAGGEQQSENGHFTDRYKKPNHPTFSDESIYHGQDGYRGGAWEDIGEGNWIFSPGDTNLKMRSPSQLRGYLQQHDPSVSLVMPKPKN